MCLTCWNWTNIVTKLSLSRFQKVNQCSGIFLVWCIVCVCSAFIKSVQVYEEENLCLQILCTSSNWTSAADRSRQDFFGVPEAMYLFVWGSIRLSSLIQGENSTA